MFDDCFAFWAIVLVDHWFVGFFSGVSFPVGSIVLSSKILWMESFQIRGSFEPKWLSSLLGFRERSGI